MGTPIAQTKKQIAEAASAASGVVIDADWVEIANPKSGAHLALPVFRLAAQLQKSPPEIAHDLAGKLDSSSFEQIEASGPYVNFWLSNASMVDFLQSSHDYLSGSTTADKTAVVEFLSPNLAKPLSIGHLRNVLQGRFLTNLLRFDGYNVITDNHIGDWGTVFGMWVVGFEMFSGDTQLENDGNKELGRVYVEVRKALKTEESAGKTQLKDRIQEWLKKLEDGDQAALEYHQKFSQIGLEDISKHMQKLDFAFDHNLGESFYIARGKQLVEELIESGDAVKNEDGSVVIDLQDQGIETPMLIQKANGAALYATSDIATIEYREQTWNPDVVVYVVGAEQQFHFQQLFAANQKIGWSDARLKHHWYGLIEEIDQNGNRTKMSSRSNAVFMVDLLELAHQKAHGIAADDMNDQDIHIIATGALTFQEFAAGHKSNTLFDWEAMFSLSGFSGPYTQYAAVRIASILSKVNTTEYVSPTNYAWEKESDLLWVMARFTHAVSEATDAWEGVKLTEYAYELSKAWNKYYETVPIIASEGDDLRARTWIAHQVYEHLSTTLGILGIQIPSKM